MSKSASDFCGDLLADPNLPGMVGRRATEYVSDQIWTQITRGWSGRRCLLLAQLAREMLAGRERLHDALGEAAGGLLGLFNRPPLEQRFAAELVKQLPLPAVSENIIAAARGLQVTGVVVCLARNRPVVQCACFMDVVKVEGKAKVRSLIVAGTEDWVGLGRP